jgi:hypothetical protein
VKKTASQLLHVTKLSEKNAPTLSLVLPWICHRNRKNPRGPDSCSRTLFLHRIEQAVAAALMAREEAALGGGSGEGGSGNGFALGAGGSGGSSASQNLWHGGLAYGSFRAFMATAAGGPGGGTRPWGGVPCAPGAGATSFRGAAPTAYNGAAMTIPAYGVVAMAPAYGATPDNFQWLRPYALSWCGPDALPWQSPGVLPQRHPDECCASWMAGMVDRSNGHDTRAGLAPCRSWSFDIGRN